MKAEKMTKEALFAIKPGKVEVFQFDSPDAIKSARAYITELTNTRKQPKGVERWKTQANWENAELFVTAVKKENT